MQKYKSFYIGFRDIIHRPFSKYCSIIIIKQFNKEHITHFQYFLFRICSAIEFKLGKKPRKI